MDISKTLLALRQERHLSRREVAEETGITQSAYTKYELPEENKDHYNPGYDNLVKLADFYGVTTDYLLGREPRTPETPQSSEKQKEKRFSDLFMEMTKEQQEIFLDTLQKLAEDKGTLRKNSY